MQGIVSNIAQLKLTDLVNQGRQALADKYPRDFEIYMMALELVDDSDQQLSVDYFMFPVMPSSIEKRESEATTIQNTFTGITIFNKSGFTPDEITISGNFGRSFKFTNMDKRGETPPWKALSGTVGTSIAEGFYTSDSINATQSNKVEELPYGIKTGFGCIKILQSIIHKAKSRGATGKSFKLFLYNPALGESYLVVPTKSPLSFSQDDGGSNMIWKYTLNLLIIADLADVAVTTRAKQQKQYAYSIDSILGGVGGVPSVIRRFKAAI